MDDVERGLPLAEVDRISREVAPGDAAFPFRLVPRATLARRRKALAETPGDAMARLSSEESSRVARLGAVWEFAVDVWGGPEKARAFLFRPHAMLEGRRPIDLVLANEFGRPIVEGILGRLKYGSAA
jgi:putative toxin-antitoxin system antitoxin component (TIGR02293 family)